MGMLVLPDELSEPVTPHLYRISPSASFARRYRALEILRRNPVELDLVRSIAQTNTGMLSLIESTG